MLTGADLFRIGSRPITPLGTAVVLVLLAALTISLTRSRLWLIAPALVGAYIARRIGLRTGFIKWLDHRVLEKVSGTFDNIEGWLVAFVACSTVLLVFHFRRPQPRRDHQ